MVSEKSACQLMWLKRDDPKSSFPSVPLKTIILGASGDGDFPVVEETVGFVTGPASSLGLLLFYDDFFCDSDNLG